MKRASLWLVTALLVCRVAFANSYEYRSLEVPMTEDIVAFTNGLPPGTGERSLKSKDEIMRFLREARNNLDVQSWNEYGNGGGRMVSCEGVFLDRKGQFYFWFLRNPRMLNLETSDDRTALLELAK